MQFFLLRVMHNVHQKGDVHMDLKSKIEKLLSEILSEQHDCKVVLTFETRQEPNCEAV